MAVNANSPDDYTGKGFNVSGRIGGRVLSRKNNPMLGVFMTWREISGSGVAIGMELIPAAV
jgi:hypothetical protein